ncbi:MAG: DUF1800 family protein [Pseudomonadota bacterium]
MQRLLYLIGLIGFFSIVACSSTSEETTPTNPNIDTDTSPNEETNNLSQASLLDASLLVSQSTFGGDFNLIKTIADKGLSTWIDEQMQLAPQYHMPDVNQFLQTYGDDFDEATEIEIEGESLQNPGMWRRYVWWHHTLSAPDILRQRVAFALSQIFVVSERVGILGENPAALPTYYDVLLKNAFGNFRDLLTDITFSPAMGVYLSHFNNQQVDVSKGTFPDENYAREIMQLFTIGLYELNDDGSQKIDAAGNPIPTYNNADITAFARVFTGFITAEMLEPDFAVDAEDELLPDFSVPMILNDSVHDTGEKQLLNGVILPAGQTAVQDITGALDNLFRHPNVGPFISRLLIQRLITSNPTPEYIARISTVFNNNGNNIRGDMAAVIKAILLDPEARQLNNASPEYFGKLRQPLVRYVQMLKGLGLDSTDNTFYATGLMVQETTKQHALAAPSVFNFFSPNYSPIGEITTQGLVAPEFELSTSNTLITYINHIAWTLFEGEIFDQPRNSGTITIARQNWQTLMDDPQKLLDRLNIVLANGQLSNNSQQIILTTLTSLEDLPTRFNAAIYLIMTSPDFLARI